MIVYLQKHKAGFTGRVSYMITPGIVQQVVSITSVALLVQAIIDVDVLFGQLQSVDVSFGQLQTFDVKF